MSLCICACYSSLMAGKEIVALRIPFLAGDKKDVCVIKGGGDYWLCVP